MDYEHFHDGTNIYRINIDDGVASIRRRVFNGEPIYQYEEQPFLQYDIINHMEAAGHVMLCLADMRYIVIEYNIYEFRTINNLVSYHRDPQWGLTYAIDDVGRTYLTEYKCSIPAHNDNPYSHFHDIHDFNQIGFRNIDHLLMETPDYPDAGEEFDFTHSSYPIQEYERLTNALANLRVQYKDGDIVPLTVELYVEIMEDYSQQFDVIPFMEYAVLQEYINMI